MPKAETVYQEFCEIVEDLRSLGPDTAILVEGRKDAAALRKLGVGGPIIQLHSGGHLQSRLSRYVEIIILLDYDPEGRSLSRKAEAAIRPMGIRPNLEYSKRIQKACMGELSHVEGLHTYLHNLAARVACDPI